MEKIKTGNSLMDAVKYMLKAEPESANDEEISFWYYETIYNEMVEFGMEVSSLSEDEVKEKLEKRINYEK
jgi:hypothetical protein